MSDSKMRILIINAVSDRSERGLYTLLFRQGVEVELVLDPKDPAIEELRNEGIRVTALHIAHRLDFKASREIRSIIKNRPVDLIYAPANRGLAAALRASRGMNIALVTYRGTLGNLSLLNPTVLLTHRNPRVSAIVCNCDAVRDYLLSLNIPDSKLRRVYKGHDLSWYRPKGILTRSQLGLNENDFVVVMVANLRALKGVDILASAVSKLKDRVPIQLVLVGEGNPKFINRIANRSALGERFHALGFRRDIPDILKLSDVSVMASTRREGVPRAIVESMANQVPVVVTSIGGMKEIVEDGISGVVVPPSNIDAMSEALNRLYSDKLLRKQLGAAARKRVEDHLGLEHYVAEMKAVFESVRHKA